MNSLPVLAALTLLALALGSRTVTNQPSTETTTVSTPTPTPVEVDPTAYAVEVAAAADATMIALKEELRRATLAGEALAQMVKLATLVRMGPGNSSCDCRWRRTASFDILAMKFRARSSSRYRCFISPEMLRCTDPDGLIDCECFDGLGADPRADPVRVLVVARKWPGQAPGEMGFALRDFGRQQ